MGKRKVTPVLGLDVSSTTVKLLELSYSGDRYRVESYAVSSLPQDAVIEKNVNDVDGVANAIRSVVAQSRTKLKTSAAAVAGSSVISTTSDGSAASLVSYTFSATDSAVGAQTRATGAPVL